MLDLDPYAGRKSWKRKKKKITFSFCISFFKAEILIFISSISCSGRTWMLGQESESSKIWKVKSARGMYHLHSYCWWRLHRGKGYKDTGVKKEGKEKLLQIHTGNLLLFKLLQSWHPATLIRWMTALQFKGKPIVQLFFYWKACFFEGWANSNECSRIICRF